MLRITVTESPSGQRWTLQGRLAGLEVGQLQACWNESRTAREGRGCIVDLTNLTSVDKGGEEVLQKMMSEGAQFRACGVYITHLLESIKAGCCRNSS